MKKTGVLLVLFLVWGCSGREKKVPDFGADIIHSEGLSEDVSPKGLELAIADAKKNALKTAFELFSDRELSDENPGKDRIFAANHSLYIKKAKIERKSAGNGQTGVSLRVHFLTERFVAALARENLLASGRVKIAVFPVFYSSYPLSLEKFREGFDSQASPDFSFFFSTAPFESSDPSLGKFDYAFLSEVYSYSISPAAEMGMNMAPVVSSGAFKILQTADLRTVSSFGTRENSMESTWEKSVGASLLACGVSARAGAVKAIAAEEAGKKRFSVIFAGVRDLNTLLKIKTAMNSMPFPGVYLKSFYDGTAVFSIYAGRMSPEELSSFIIRTNAVPMHIDYVDKAEVKFNIM